MNHRRCRPFPLRAVLRCGHSVTSPGKLRIQRVRLLVGEIERAISAAGTAPRQYLNCAMNHCYRDSTARRSLGHRFPRIAVTLVLTILLPCSRPGQDVVEAVVPFVTGVLEDRAFTRLPRNLVGPRFCPHRGVLDRDLCIPGWSATFVSTAPSGAGSHPTAPPMKLVSPRKLVVSITRVSPSQWPRELPNHWRMSDSSGGWLSIGTMRASWIIAKPSRNVTVASLL